MPLTELVGWLAPDLIHIEFMNRARRVMSLLPEGPTPVIVSIRGDYPVVPGVDDETAYGPVWKRTSLVHAVSRATLAVAHGRGLPRSMPTAIFPSGTDLSYFVPPERTFGRIGIIDHPLRIVVVSRFQWKKGIDFGLQAVRQLLERGIVFHCDVYGYGPDEERTRFTVHDLGLEGVVTLHGGVPRVVVRDALAQADVLLQPSVSEGLPNSLVEAQAMGVPVVCTDAGGSGEAVEHGVTGLVVPRRDPGALADALEVLARDAGLRARMSAAGPERARAGFSALASLDATEAMYRSVMASNPRPDTTLGAPRAGRTASPGNAKPLPRPAERMRARTPGTRGRILLVIGRFPQPTETLIAAKVAGLLQRGWDVRVAALKPAETEWPAFFPQLAHAGWSLSDLLVGPVDADLVRDVDPDLVHFEFAVQGCDLAVPLARAGRPMVVTLRGSDMRTVHVGDPAYYATLWPHLAFVESRSEDLWRIAQQRGCPPEMPHAVIRTGVDLDAFACPVRRHDAPIGTPDRPVQIVAVGRLDWKKGYRFAIQAVRLLVDRGIACRLTIVGDGERLPELRYCVRDLKLEQMVVFAGLLDRTGVVAQLARADLLMQASVSEGVPNSVIEGQAAGLPVVATDVGGTGEGVAPGASALLVPSRDPRALADAVERLVGDAALRERMGAAGVEFVRQAYGLNQYLDRTEEMYRQVLSGGRTSATH